VDEDQRTRIAAMDNPPMEISMAATAYFSLRDLLNVNHRPRKPLIVHLLFYIVEPKLFAYQGGQCDPKKCSAAKLERFGLLKGFRRISRIPKGCIVLDPYSNIMISPLDKNTVQHRGLVVIDCSWAKADIRFFERFKGKHRSLPFIVPVNPVNYGKPGKLSSVEALACVLSITGFEGTALTLLEKFKWGPHFLELNAFGLSGYQKTMSQEDMENMQDRFIAFLKNQ